MQLHHSCILVDAWHVSLWGCVLGGCFDLNLIPNVISNIFSKRVAGFDTLSDFDLCPVVGGDANVLKVCHPAATKLLAYHCRKK